MNSTTITRSKPLARNMDSEVNEPSVTSRAVAAHGSVWLTDTVESACQRIAPLWPLHAFVAVNPYFGLRHQDFEQASETLARVAGSSLVMPRRYYREHLSTGRTSRMDLEQALQQHGLVLDAATVESAAIDSTPSLPVDPIKLVSNVLEDLDGLPWNGFVIERISQFAAAYFDQGQAGWPLPWRAESLYDAWRHYAEIDLSPEMMGLRGFRTAVTVLPKLPMETIALALQRLAIPADMAVDYLHAALLNIGGWAAWTRYLRWEQEVVGGQEGSIVELLAIRLAWELILLNARQAPALGAGGCLAERRAKAAVLPSTQCASANGLCAANGLRTGLPERNYCKTGGHSRGGQQRGSAPLDPLYRPRSVRMAASICATRTKNGNQYPRAMSTGAHLTVAEDV